MAAFPCACCCNRAAAHRRLCPLVEARVMLTAASVLAYHSTRNCREYCLQHMDSAAHAPACTHVSCKQTHHSSCRIVLSCVLCAVAQQAHGNSPALHRPDKICCTEICAMCFHASASSLLFNTRQCADSQDKKSPRAPHELPGPLTSLHPDTTPRGPRGRRHGGHCGRRRGRLGPPHDAQRRLLGLCDLPHGGQG